MAPVVYGDEEGEENNPSCAFLDPGWNEVKVNQAPNGSYSDGDGALVFKVENSDGKVFDWSSNIGVDAVVVKGGNRGSNVYFYEGEATSDKNVRSPDNTKGNTPAVSHISACYDEEAGDDQNERPSEPEQPENEEGDQPSEPDQPQDDDDGREDDGGDNQRPAEPDEPQEETDEPRDQGDEPVENERQAEPDDGDGDGGEEEQTIEDEQQESGEGEGDVKGISETDEGTSDDDAAGEVLEESSDSGGGDDLPFTGAPLGMLLIVALGLLFAGAAGRSATRD